MRHFFKKKTATIYIIRKQEFCFDFFFFGLYLASTEGPTNPQPKRRLCQSSAPRHER